MNTVISSYLGGKPIEVPISMVRKLLPREVPGVQVDLPEHAAQKEPLTLYKVSERQYVKDELDRLYEQLVERSTGKYVVKDGKMVFKRGSDGVYHSERMQELWEEEAARLREKFGALVAEKAAKAGPGVPVLRRPGEYVPGAALLQTVPKTKRAMEKLDLALIPLDEDNPERSIEPLLYKGDVTGSTFNKAVKPKLQILLSLKDDLPKGTMTTAAVNMVKSFAMSNLPGFLPVYSSVTRQFAPADGKFHMEYEANLPSQREAKENLIYGIRTWNAFVQDLKNNVAPTIAFGNLQSRLQVAANEIHRKREEQNLRFANEAKKERYAEESGTMEGLEGVAAMEFGPRRHRRSGWMT
jgi:hypothetical protein